MLYNTVPTGTQYVENSATQAPIRNDDLLIWQLPTLKPGNRFVVSFAVQVTLEETITVVNTAYIGNTDFPVLATTINERELVCNNQPTAIALAKFEAVPLRDGVRLNWTTALEQDSFGFALYRSPTHDRAIATRLNPDWIASTGRNSGATYTWLDGSAQAGVAYTYWLQEMELSGALKEYGPVQLPLEMPTPSTASSSMSPMPATTPVQAHASGVVMAAMPTALPAQPAVAQEVVATPAPTSTVAQVVQATLVPQNQSAASLPAALPTVLPAPASGALPTVVAGIDAVNKSDERANAVSQSTSQSMEILAASPQSTVVPMAPASVHMPAATPAAQVNAPTGKVQAAPITLPISALSFMPLALIASTGALLAVLVMWLLIATLSRRR